MRCDVLPERARPALWDDALLDPFTVRHLAACETCRHERWQNSKLRLTLADLSELRMRTDPEALEALFEALDALDERAMRRQRAMAAMSGLAAGAWVVTRSRRVS